MKKGLLLLFILINSVVKGQFLAPYQGTQLQPRVQLDYWMYNTHAGNGSSNQYPVVAASKADMDNIFNTNNSNTTLVKSGRTSSSKILDWQSSTELNALGITAPNSGTYFAIKVQGTFIPLESGTYYFTLETDDASDFTINGTTIISAYVGQAVPALGTHVGSINLTAGQKYSFEARMQQGGGGYGMRLFWKSPIQAAAPASYTSQLPANTYFQSWTQNLQELVSNPDMDGSSAAKAAPSAKYIQTAFNKYTDGVYWINLPYVGPTQIYCLLNSAVNGGGWMMMMKATRGTTFNYSSTYWTAVNTLNPSACSRADGDAKFDAMNYFYAKDMMALWPDIAWNANSSTTGGSVNTNGSYNVWCWLQNNFNNGIRITPINFFNSASKLYFGDAKSYSGWNGGVFSAQTSVRFYGFNYTNASNAQVRWGFAFNENAPLALYPSGDEGSNDVSGGIGMNYGSYSAGDYIGCCQDNYGINRTARVEIYVR
ncbi:PA14 domain-containing protein [Aquirufa lenticrescens]